MQPVFCRYTDAYGTNRPVFLRHPYTVNLTHRSGLPQADPLCSLPRCKTPKTSVYTEGTHSQANGAFSLYSHLHTLVPTVHTILNVKCRHKCQFPCRDLVTGCDTVTHKLQSAASTEAHGHGTHRSPQRSRQTWGKHPCKSSCKAWGASPLHTQGTYCTHKAHTQGTHPASLFFLWDVIKWSPGERWEKAVPPIRPQLPGCSGRAATPAILVKEAEVLGQPWPEPQGRSKPQPLPVVLAWAELLVRSPGWGWGRGMRMILGVAGCGLPR